MIVTHVLAATRKQCQILKSADVGKQRYKRAKDGAGALSDQFSASGLALEDEM